MKLSQNQREKCLYSLLATKLLYDLATLQSRIRDGGLLLLLFSYAFTRSWKLWVDSVFGIGGQKLLNVVI